MSNFRIGQEVVCVVELFEPTSDDLIQDVVKGGIYTINHVQHDFDYTYLGFIECNQGLVYRSDGFQPLQTASEESDMEQSIKEALQKELFEA